MKESTTYQAIKEEGRVEEARRILLRIGAAHLGGPPTTEQQTAIDSINDAARLEDLAVRAGQVGGWAELLETPPPTPTPRRRKKS